METTSSTPAPWGDLVTAARSGALVLDSPNPGALLVLGGADRVRFLNGYVTCQVDGLATGTGTYGFVTTVKGRVQTDLTVLALDDSLLLVVPPDRREGLAQHLGKYILADRVTIEERESRSLTLLGPSAWDSVRRVLGPTSAEAPEGPWSSAVHDVEGVRTVVVREPSLLAPSDGGLAEVPRWTVWWLGEAEDVARVAAEARATLGDVPAASADFETALRVFAGRARHGVDFDEEHFPHETGLEDEGVSYTKGCYLGQEVVARIHYRGGVNRSLRGLVLVEGDPGEVAGHALSHEGREAGSWTTVAQLANGSTLGLSILHHRVEPGTLVTVEGTASPATARVVELPWGADDLQPFPSGDG